MSYQCPKCQGVICNRRNRICGYCGAELPAELLFTAEEIGALDQEEEATKELHRLRQAQRDAEEEERRARSEQHRS